jgi:molecular chaperone DnaK
MVVGGYFHRLIDRNTTVPTSKSHVFTTIRDDQTSVKILVFQGESDRAEDNELLGEFVLSGLRKAKRGDVEVEVTFEISADGIVSVSAKDLETGLQQSITVTASSGLTESELQRMATESRDYMVSVRQEHQSEVQRQQIEKLVDEAQDLLPAVERALAGTPFGNDSLDSARAVLSDAREAIQRRDPTALGQISEPLGRTVNLFRGLVQKDRPGAG